MALTALMSEGHKAADVARRLVDTFRSKFGASLADYMLTNSSDTTGGATAVSRNEFGMANNDCDMHVGNKISEYATGKEDNTRTRTIDGRQIQFIITPGRCRPRRAALRIGVPDGASL